MGSTRSPSFSLRMTTWLFCCASTASPLILTSTTAMAGTLLRFLHLDLHARDGGLRVVVARLAQIAREVEVRRLVGAHVVEHPLRGRLELAVGILRHQLLERLLRLIVVL